jgi:hypothetical protein
MDHLRRDRAPAIGRAQSAALGAEDFDLEPWPYSAFFGAPRLRDEVKVDFDVALTPDD